jgi:DNA-3-methyladenine glycosylase
MVPLPREFYEPTADVVAPALLGHWLLRKTPRGWAGGAIVETEAYLVGDPACHAYVGRTKRNKVMWGPPGFAYVYLIYGNHFCLNAVCRAEGTAEAVLIRAIEPSWGLDFMLRNRKVTLHQLTSGPGKLCAALAVDRGHDGVDLSSASSPLIMARNPDRPAFLGEAGLITITSRIGLTKAADLQLRFCLEQSPFVSRKQRRMRAGSGPEPA